MSLPSFGVRNPVISNLCMFAIIFAGLFYGLSLRREFFPEIRPNLITVTAPYPGASPDEVERSLVRKIEDAMIGMDGVKELSSTAGEGLAMVTIELESGFDIDESLADVKRRVDALQDLPEASERMVVDKVEPNLPGIILNLSGGADERAMKDKMRAMIEDLETLPGMGDLSLGGTRRDEMRVEVRPEALVEHQLSIADVAAKVRASMAETPGGSVRTSEMTVTLRTLGAKEQADEVRNIIVKAGQGGQVVRLGEVARVTSGFADTDTWARLNGERAYSITVYKTGPDDIISMVDMVKAYVRGLRGEPYNPTMREQFAGLARRPGDSSPRSPRERAYVLGRDRGEGGLPGEVRLTTDLARFVSGRLDLLTRNALSGAVLVFVCLMLFLSWRSSFWVLAGLVVSVAGTLTAMHFLGITLNLLTMFGLIIVLGLLVDDAIVVAENITTRHERGESAMQAAIKATEQVGWPVLATVVTTIFAFLPFALIEGQMGDMLGALPTVVAVALAVSLFESLFILPSHMAHSLAVVDQHAAQGKKSLLDRMSSRMDVWREGFFSRLLIPRYSAALAWCLKARYLTVVLFVASLILAFGMLAGGRPGFVFFPSNDSETVNISLKMPVGTPAEMTDKALRKIENAAMAQDDAVEAVYAIAGASFALDGSEGSQSGHLGQIILELKAVEQRTRTSEQVREAIRADLGEMPGVEALRLEDMGAGPQGPGITLAIAGDNEQHIFEVVSEVKKSLAAIRGVYDISDDADAGRPELRIELRPGADELGFTTDSLARQIRGAIYGLEAYTYAGDREDIDVRVMFPEAFRRRLSSLEHMYVARPDGLQVPLREVATITETSGYANIKRVDRQRAVTVSADVLSSSGSPESVMATLTGLNPAPEGSGVRTFEEVLAHYPGIKVMERGRQKNFRESMSSLPLGMLAASVLIYVSLAWLFKSYTQPFIVMLAIPFSLVGAVAGHLIMGYPLTFLSLVGFLALTGVVVNDSLVFMEFFNHRYRAGASIRDALIETGKTRIRAILLTTITTIAGLAPLMMEQSFQAKFLIPMAITISFGLASATFLTLLLLPCLLLIFSDIRGVFRSLWIGDWTFIHGLLDEMRTGRPRADAPRAVAPELEPLHQG